MTVPVRFSTAVAAIAAGLIIAGPVAIAGATPTDLTSGQIETFKKKPKEPKPPKGGCSWGGQIYAYGDVVSDGQRVYRCQNGTWVLILNGPIGGGGGDQPTDQMPTI